MLIVKIFGKNMLLMEKNKNLVEMLESNDKDCVYLAVSMIRNSHDISDKEIKKLLDKISLFERVKNYSDVCKELGVEELTVDSFIFLSKEQRLKALACHQIQNIGKLFNGKWKIKWDGKQKNWYPWFEVKASGLVFSDSSVFVGGSSAAVCYYKDRETSDFVGKTFIDIYSILIN